MKKWLPYLIAAVLGVGVAVIMFLPDTSTTKSNGDKPAKSTAVTKIDKEGMSMKRVPEGADPAAPSRAEQLMADRKAGIAPPPPGPLTATDQARLEKATRSFNKHYTGVAVYWNRLGPLVSAADPAVAKECQQMDLYLRDQSKLPDDDLNVTDVLTKELQLEKKVRTLNIDNADLTAMLDYINNSANTTLQGGDPSTITRPGK